MVALGLSSLQGPTSSSHTTGILLSPARGAAVPRKSPLPHHKPPNLPPNSVHTLHGTSSLPWSSALSTDHFHRHLQPPSPPSSSAFLHQQVSHSHSWGCQPWVHCLLLEGNVLHRVKMCPTGCKCDPQGAAWREGSTSGTARVGVPTAHPASCFEGSRRDSSLAAVVIRKWLSAVYASLT